MKRTLYISVGGRSRRRILPFSGILTTLLFLVVMTGAHGIAQNFTNTGVLNNTGIFRVKNVASGLPPAVDGIFEYFGSAQLVPARAYRNLYLSGSGQKQSYGGNFSVTDSLRIFTGVTCSVESLAVVDLGTKGTLEESGYLHGAIRKTASLIGSSGTENFGNIGISISWTGTSPGLTVARRISGVRHVATGNHSVLRCVEVAPASNSGLNASLTFRYNNVELDGMDPAKLVLWKSSDSGATWHVQRQVMIDTAAHTVTKLAITSFAWWTLSDSTHPLGLLNPTPQTFAAVSGSGQSGAISTAVAPCIIRVTDAVNDPYEGTPVTFTIVSTPAGASGQSLTILTAQTDIDGFASTVLTLGTKAGDYVVQASSTDFLGNPKTFVLTAVHGPAQTLSLVSGNSQVDTVGLVLGQLMKVKVMDVGANPVPGYNIVFNISSAPVGAMGHMLSVTNTITDSAGEASTSLQLGSIAGAYTVTATAGSLTGSPATFNATAIPRGNPIPFLASISPMEKTTADTTFTLTVNGTKFMPQSKLQWNGSDRLTTWISATKLHATIYASDIDTAGTFTLAVTNPAPGGGASDSLTFQVTNAVPLITSATPSNILFGSGGTTVTLRGKYFAPGAVLAMDGVARTATFLSRTQLTVDLAANEVASMDTMQFSVTNPAPGGGTSADFAFTVRGSSIAGHIFNDRNQNGTQDVGEYGVSGRGVTVIGQNSGVTRSTATLAGGTFLLTDLPPDTYELSMPAAAGWVQTFPLASVVTVDLQHGADTTGFTFGTWSAQDSIAYRTFSMDSLGISKPSSSKPVHATWTVDLPNLNGQPITSLKVTFTQAISSMTSFAPFTTAIATTTNGKVWEFSGASLDSGETASISGITVKAKAPTVQRFEGYADGKKLFAKAGGKQYQPSAVDYLYDLPTVGSIRNLVYAAGAFTETAGMIVGLDRSDSARYYAWLCMAKSADFQKTLYDKTGLQRSMPRGFTAANTGRKLLGKQKSLAPSVFNNRLMGQVAALKMNIAASQLGITPVGFGELLYDDGPNPLSGRTIADLALGADSILTQYRGVLQGQYTMYDSVITKINKAFNGPMDTISYLPDIQLTGAVALSSVPFLRLNPKVVPVTAHRLAVAEGAMDDEESVAVQPDTEEVAAVENLPQSFALLQNYPNPFNPMTNITFDLPVQAVVTLKVFNMLGQEVAVVSDGVVMDAGRRIAQFNAVSLPSGTYIYRLVARAIMPEAEQLAPVPSTYTESKKMILLR